MADEEAPKEVKRDPDDILKDWFKARVVSSFKCKPEAADALVNNESSRVAVETFLNSETCQRLLVFSNPDLMAVRAASRRRLLLTRSRSPPRETRLPSSSGHIGSDPFAIAPPRVSFSDSYFVALRRASVSSATARDLL
jgi:hypothetical protein